MSIEHSYCRETVVAEFKPVRGSVNPDVTQHTAPILRDTAVTDAAALELHRDDFYVSETAKTAHYYLLLVVERTRAESRLQLKSTIPLQPSRIYRVTGDVCAQIYSVVAGEEFPELLFGEALSFLL